MWHDDETFSGFGPNPLNPHPVRGLERVTAADRTRLRVAVRESCPRVPGVYGMLDGQSRLIYVGKSKSLRSRLLSYFNPANAAEKAGKIIETARGIVWETQPSEFAALLREQQLIRRWTPRWNVQEMPRRQRPVYLCLGHGPATYFFLSRLPPEGVLACEGPFRGAGRMSRAVETLNKYFRLRDCKNTQPFHFADQLSLFDIGHRPGCLRYELGTCSGPCTGAVSHAKYDLQVNAARSFLDGFNDEPLVATREAMEQAAATMCYERAAKLRDDLRGLEYLYRQLGLLADARREYTFIYSVPGYDGCGVWYLIRAGEISDVARAPTCPTTYAAARSGLARWRKEAATTHQRGLGPYPHTLSLVAAWFRKDRSRLERTFQPSEAGRKYRRLARHAVV